MDASSNETGFEIERSANGTTGWALIFTTAANAQAYSNTGLTANTPYFYRVRATNTGGQSAYSNTANATTLPTAPTAPNTLAATAFSQTQIDLTWVDASSNETGFEIERSANGTTGWALIFTDRRQRSGLLQHRAHGEHPVLLQGAGHEHRRPVGLLQHGQRHDAADGAGRPDGTGGDGDFGCAGRLGLDGCRHDGDRIQG